jgi:SAM-dependent methyltransferase
MFNRLFEAIIKWLTHLKNPMIVNEHFVPKLGLELEPYLQRKDRNAAHHLTHYYWAIAVLEDRPDLHSILDVACGSGYGSYMIAKRFPHMRVVGADYDRTALRYAEGHFSLPNLSFKFGDVALWDKTIGTDVFDCIISYETIEHVPHREIMMENLVNHLNDDGHFLMTTPCGWEENLLRPRWPMHKIEYSSASLYDFMKRYFVTIIRPDEKRMAGELPFPHRHLFEHLHANGIEYNLKMNPAVCYQPIKFKNPYRIPAQA